MPDAGPNSRQISAERVLASVQVLRDAGVPLDLREITKRSAIKMGWSLMYEDVAGVLVGAERRGEVRLVRRADDFREYIWEST